ncbi:class I SAM-dependent methyltransferase [Sphingomonas montanisoli]|uniref:Methyltransferase domain-containing protein n=1 Tax=Sphingomonas montanisoli TaxID=2606412 RepID=A0A5D9BZC7_9SPHN|nr:methyltransferase domain-containing protein [Sphingomonas montanisoli]TZG24746.1 methyltransferase domain-containing protein [Sphingomonas montanisoli]
MGNLPGEIALKSRTRLSRRGSAPNPFALFFTQFLRHPVMIGSIIPSSRRTIEHMLSRVDWANTKLFVEYGPGVGTFCGAILDRLPADGTLLVIDTNPVFIDYLRRRFADPRFIAVSGSAADVNEIIATHGFAAADYVLSGLPFSTLPPGVAPAIAEATHRVLAPGGQFLVYQYAAKIVKLLRPHFDRIDEALEWINIPPCHLYWAHKDEAAQAAKAA